MLLPDLATLHKICCEAYSENFYEKIGFKFHSQTQLDYPKFKEELKGMQRMYLELQIDKTKFIS